MRLNKKARSLIGYIGERLAKEALEREGYTIESFDRCDARLYLVCGEPVKPMKKYKPGGPEYEYPDNCKRGEKWLKLMHYRDKLVKIDRSVTRGMNLDFYAIKNGKEFIVESKANSARIRKSQIKLIEYAKELGYIPFLIKSKVKVTGGITEIKEL